MKNKQPEKQISKYENMFIILSAADFLLSTTDDSKSLLTYMNTTSYITNDTITDATSYINYSLRKADLPQTAFDIFNAMFTELLNIGLQINSVEILQINNPVYAKVSELAHNFIKTYTYNEYAHIIRKLINVTHYIISLIPIIYILDYFYDNDYMYINCTKKTEKLLYSLPCVNQRLTPAFLCISTIDNITESQAVQKLTNVMSKYLTLKYTNVKAIEIALDHFLCVYAAKFYRGNSFRNKFTITPVKYSYHQLVQYFDFISKIPKDVETVLINALMNIPRDILTTRRFILKNGKLPFDLELSRELYNKNDNSKTYISDIILNETTVTFDNEPSYRILYITYSFCNFTQTIPLNLNDIHTILCTSTCIDLYIILFILDLYKVFTLPDLYSTPLQIDSFNTVFAPAIQNWLNAKNNTEPTDTTNSKPHNSYNRLLQNAEITISAHLRKLPKGQIASEEAKQYAKSVYLTVPEGYTVVSEHIRKYTNKQA